MTDAPYLHCDALILYPRSYDKNLSGSFVRPPIATAACSDDQAEYLTEESENIVTYDEYDEWVLMQDVLTQDGTESLSKVARDNEDVIVSSDEDLNDEDVPSTINSVIDQYVKYEGNFHIVRTSERHVEQLESYESDVQEQHDVFTEDNTVEKSYHSIYLETSVPDKAQHTEEFNIIKNSTTNTDENLVRKAEVLKNVVKNEDAEFASVDGDLKKSDEKLPIHETSEGKMTVDELYERYDPGQIVVHVVSKYRYFGTDMVLNEAPENLTQIVDSKRDDLVYVPSSNLNTGELRVEFRTLPI